MCGVVSALASAGRRWDALRNINRLRERDRIGYVIAGGIIGGVVSLVLSLMALRFSRDYVVDEVVVGGGEDRLVHRIGTNGLTVGLVA